MPSSAGYAPQQSASRRVRRFWPLLAGAVAAVALGTLGLHYVADHWAPDRTSYPVQGLWLDAHDGPVEWHTIKATGPGGHGADFVYLTASSGAGNRDLAFVDSVDAAHAAGLQVGAVHVYDLCAPADGQAGNFVTTVPRDRGLLPAAISISLDPEHCPNPPREATIDSELTTFINEVERHLGHPVVLMPSPEVEERYHLAARIERNVWITGDYWVPGYVSRPWVLWTATHRLHIAGVAGPVRWVAVQP
ncbi:glycoside hydrolase family 25 protein [Novosphingobium nitrogenifigens]|uniref:glycoside hydrolase family 25 protein n=1 Tax=Novosphingobium nitrogenifigens TaxID=378548 RepID=UPI000363106D|nr:glycoside hydrolase family 25 protein [Novosphingobium nitrogenifigens]